MKILVFLQGTIIMHKNARGKTREEIMKQVIEQENSVRDFGNYVPIGNATEKLKKWTSQGAEICYLSSLTENKKGREDEIVGKEGLRADKIVLDKFNFSEGKIYHRELDKEYKDVIEKIFPLPDIIIEDDCESIGGEKEMIYLSLKPEIRNKIKHIVVKEFGGIDYLSDDASKL